jgi:hypothetical protein
MFPKENTYPPYYTHYFNLIEEKNVIEALENDLNQSNQFINFIPKDKINFAYDKGKWTVKQVLQHIIDCERILAYRALHIARKDKQIIQPFNENDYVANTELNHLSIQDILIDFDACRKNTISLFKTFTNLNLIEIGKVGFYEVTPLSIGYFINGHTKHHLNIIRNRYLQQP